MLPLKYQNIFRREEEDRRRREEEARRLWEIKEREILERMRTERELKEKYFEQSILDRERAEKDRIEHDRLVSTSSLLDIVRSKPRQGLIQISGACMLLLYRNNPLKPCCAVYNVSTF